MIFSIDFGGIARTVPSIAGAIGSADRDGRHELYTGSGERARTIRDGQPEYVLIKC
jgi:hypothetical protein